MPLKNFIKENFVLVVGLALPVLLVVLFFVASVLPKSMVEPPRYEMLFTQTRYDSQSPYNVDFFVKNGVLKAHVWKVTQPGAMVNRKKLMAYDGKTQSVREIPYDVSKVGDAPNMAEISLDEFKNMKVDGSSKSPDGFEFENGGYGSGGLVTDLFAGGYHSGTPRLKKGSAVFKISEGSNTNYYGYDIQFIGWIIQK
jgi:hypothetical protein